MAGGWSTSAFRWLEFDFSVGSWRGMFSFSSSRWSPRRLRLMGWSIVDDLLWGLITAFESLSIVSTLCFFFLFCGCTL